MGRKTRQERRKAAARARLAQAQVQTVVEQERPASGPTPETKAKFRVPIVARLVDSGRIGGAELQAAQEIERVFEKISIGMRTRAVVLDRVDGQRGQEPDRFIDAYWDRYRPWADEWSTRRKLYGDRTLEIVFDVLFGTESGRELDRKHGLRNGSAISAFVAALRDYAARAGWVEPRVAAGWRAPAVKAAA